MNLYEIKNPKFLKKIKKNELINLCEDIRKFIIEKVSITGGHLSSNLGIVELTVMLHKVFDSPKDKIIFDVSHQAYTHKILTGRAHLFDKLRQKDGLSGFTKRCESEHDVYEAGHSSTSLSAALGMALARDMDKKNYNVIAVIGDGSIGNGLCYEALNQIGETKTKMIIILNDNEMSISKNVGALHNHLDKIRSNSSYSNTKNKTKSLLDRIPIIGLPIKDTMRNIKKSMKRLYIDEGFIFEELGIEYYGPINGHDLKELELYLNMAKKSNGPVLIHVITEKGKGYKYAEEDKVGKWHGVSAFDIETGNSLQKTDKLTFSECVSNTLMKHMSKDLIVITPAMAGGAKLINLSKKYPKNFIDTGIAEEHAILLANGLSLEGKIPFVSIYSTFLQRGYDEVLHDVARMNTHVILGIDRCGIVGEDGETHQGLFDLTFLLPIPNLIISTPSNIEEVNNLIFTAINTNSPFCIRYSKNRIKYEDTENKLLEIGKWKKLKDGKDATLITYGDFINDALEIHNELKKEGINIEIVNALFQKPIDNEYFNKITKKNKPIFVYEESMKIGSLGSYLKTLTDSKIDIFAIEDEFVLQGKREEILTSLKLDKQNIINKIKKAL